MIRFGDMWKSWKSWRSWKRSEELEAEGPSIIIDLTMVADDRPTTETETKVVGYFAYCSPFEVICDGEACMIAGSEAAMRKYLEMSNGKNWDRYTIKKTRFGEILNGMYLGEAYSFDEVSYSRFYPLALEEGIPLCDADFTGSTADEIKFLTVAPTSIGV